MSDIENNQAEIANSPELPLEVLFRIFRHILLFPALAVSSIVFCLSFLQYPFGSLILILFFISYPFLILALWTASAIRCRTLKATKPNSLTNKEIVASFRYLLIALTAYLPMLWRYSFIAIEV